MSIKVQDGKAVVEDDELITVVLSKEIIDRLREFDPDRGEMSGYCAYDIILDLLQEID